MFRLSDADTVEDALVCEISDSPLAFARPPQHFSRDADLFLGWGDQIERSPRLTSTRSKTIGRKSAAEPMGGRELILGVEMARVNWPFIQTRAFLRPEWRGAPAQSKPGLRWRFERAPLGSPADEAQLSLQTRRISRHQVLTLPRSRGGQRRGDSAAGNRPGLWPVACADAGPRGHEIQQYEYFAQVG